MLSVRVGDEVPQHRRRSSVMSGTQTPSVEDVKTKYSRHSSKWEGHVGQAIVYPDDMDSGVVVEFGCIGIKQVAIGKLPWAPI